MKINMTYFILFYFILSDRRLASAPKTIELVKISFPRELFLISIN